MQFELVHVLLEGLEGKVKEVEVCGEWPTWVVTSVRELLLVMTLFLKKSVMAICLVPGLQVGHTGGVGCAPNLVGEWMAMHSLPRPVGVSGSGVFCKLSEAFYGRQEAFYGSCPKGTSFC